MVQRPIGLHFLWERRTKSNLKQWYWLLSQLLWSERNEIKWSITAGPNDPFTFKKLQTSMAELQEKAIFKSMNLVMFLWNKILTGQNLDRTDRESNSAVVKHLTHSEIVLFLEPTGDSTPEHWTTYFGTGIHYIHIENKTAKLTE